MRAVVLLLFAVFVLPGCNGNPSIWWKNVQVKTHHLLGLESRYKVLEEKYEALEKEHFELEHKYTSLLVEIKSKKMSEENFKLTGSRAGRSIASISYQVPAGMEAEAKLDLALQHIREKRFAEAAATFDDFLWEPESAALQTAKNFYEAGVAWFQVKNFKKARICFEAASAHADGDEKKEINRRVDLWMRVLEKNKTKES